MLVQVKRQTKTQISNDYCDGQFDAAIGLLPKTYDGQYGKGYLDKVRETGNTPF